MIYVAVVASVAGAVPAEAVTSASVRWTCTVPLLPDYAAQGNGGASAGEGVSYLYVGDPQLRLAYGADALFVTPLDARRGWYDSAVRLGPLTENNGFVQIEISRWQRFGYRQHVAVAWAVPHGGVVHRDTGLMLADGVPHRLGISVRAGNVLLLADDRAVCSAPAAAFVRASEPKYFQVRTETSVIGANGGALVSGLRLKRDPDAAPRPYATHCVLHRYGIFWEHAGGGRYAARGAFYPNEATFFAGADPAKPCTT